MRIVNKKKFIRSMILMFGVLILISFIFANKSLSHTEKNFKKVYISSGDTLWSIAKEEKDNNEYFENKDIREIIYELKKANDLNNSNLKVGLELNIPIN